MWAPATVFTLGNIMSVSERLLVSLPAKLLALPPFYLFLRLSIKERGRPPSFLGRFHFRVSAQRVRGGRGGGGRGWAGGEGRGREGREAVGGNGWAHQTHLSSLLSYLAVRRCWCPFPAANVFAFTARAKCQHAASRQSLLISGEPPHPTRATRSFLPLIFPCSFLSSWAGGLFLVV